MSILLENFYIIGFAFLGILILFSNRRKVSPSDNDLSGSENKIKILESEIRASVKDAAKFTALADERKKEVDRLNQDLSKLRGKLDLENEEKTNLSNKVSELIAQGLAERKSSDEKIEILTQFRKDMESKFKELASEALQLQGESFSKSNIEKLEATLLPLKEHVGHFEKELRQVHEETVKDRERLKAEINQLSKKSDQISQNALELSKALKGDSQMQGAWGEMILESILEKSGLRVGEEYEIQAHRKNELIADRAGKLYDKVSGFVLNMEKVGERLTQAQDSYDTAFNQFSKGRGNVLSQVENLKTLGAKTSKSIDTDFENTEEIENLDDNLKN